MKDVGLLHILEYPLSRSSLLFTLQNSIGYGERILRSQVKLSQDYTY